MLVKIFLFVIFWLFSLGANASQSGDVWLVEDLAARTVISTTLKDKWGRKLKVVPTRQMVLLNKTFNSLKTVSELNPRFIIITGNQPNAFAGLIDLQPTVAVNFGMLDLIGYNKDEWAALLGHELAHLKLNHVLKGIIRSIPMELLSRWIQKKTDHEKTIDRVHLAMRLFDTKFSRDQERDSDYLGAIWAIQIGQNAMGAATLHNKLRKLGGDRGNPFLRSHPTSSERVATLEALASRLKVPPGRNETKTFSQKQKSRGIEEIEGIGRSLATKYRRDIRKYEELEKESKQLIDLASRVTGAEAKQHLRNKSNKKRQQAQQLRKKVQKKIADEFEVKLAQIL
jgi:predicted Zn-dependent protease